MSQEKPHRTVVAPDHSRVENESALFKTGQRPWLQTQLFLDALGVKSISWNASSVIIITIDLGAIENNYTCDGANINGLVLILSTSVRGERLSELLYHFDRWRVFCRFFRPRAVNGQSPLNPVYCSAPDLCIPLIITVLYFNPLTGYAWLLATGNLFLFPWT